MTAAIAVGSCYCVQSSVAVAITLTIFVVLIAFAVFE